MFTCIIASGHMWLAVAGSNAMINMDEVTVIIDRPSSVYALKDYPDQVEFRFRNKSGFVTVKGKQANVQKAIMSCKK